MKKKKIPLGLEHRAVEITGDENARIPPEQMSTYKPVQPVRRAYSLENEHDVCLDCGTLLVPCTCRLDCPGGMCPVCP